MTECTARWEHDEVFLCGGGRDNPEPCVLHGCGELSVVDPQGDVVTVFHGPCRCPLPEDE